jgi:hypothetical protein
MAIENFEAIKNLVESNKADADVQKWLMSQFTPEVFDEVLKDTSLPVTQKILSDRDRIVTQAVNTRDKTYEEKVLPTRLKEFEQKIENSILEKYSLKETEAQKIEREMKAKLIEAEKEKAILQLRNVALDKAASYELGADAREISDLFLSQERTEEGVTKLLTLMKERDKRNQEIGRNALLKSNATNPRTSDGSDGVYFASQADAAAAFKGKPELMQDPRYVKAYEELSARINRR